MSRLSPVTHLSPPFISIVSSNPPTIHIYCVVQPSHHSYLLCRPTLPPFISIVSSNPPRYELPSDRIGDLVVVSEKHAVLGRSAE